MVAFRRKLYFNDGNRGVKKRAIAKSIVEKLEIKMIRNGTKEEKGRKTRSTYGKNGDENVQKKEKSNLVIQKHRLGIFGCSHREIIMNRKLSGEIDTMASPYCYCVSVTSICIHTLGAHITVYCYLNKLFIGKSIE